MKTKTLKKLIAIRGGLSTHVKNEKEVIMARSEKLDPNNNKIELKPLVKEDTKKDFKDDGFEHRSSEETTDSI